MEPDSRKKVCSQITENKIRSRIAEKLIRSWIAEKIQFAQRLKTIFDTNQLEYNVGYYNNHIIKLEQNENSRNTSALVLHVTVSL